MRARRLGNPRRRPLLARLSRATTAAKRSTRGSASSRRDLDSLRHAFGIDDYPVSGLLSGEFHLTGEYQRPLGFGGDDDRRRRRLRRAVREGDGRRCGSTAAASASTASNIAKGTGAITGAAFVGWDAHLLVQRRRPPDSGGARSPLLSYPRRAAVGPGGVHRQRQRHVRRAAQRRPVPRQRSVRRRGRRRPGHRHARASRQRAERRNRRGVAAAGGHRHRPHRADAAGATPSSRSDSTTARSIRTSACSCRSSRRSRPRSPAARSASSGELADLDHLLVDGTVDSLDMRLFDYAVQNAGADPPRARSTAGQASRSCSWSATTRGCASGGTVGLQRRAHRAAGVGRREPRHPAGLLPRRARLGPRRADGGDRRPAPRSRCSPAARRSPTAASATSRCRTRSTPSTARSTSTRGGIRLDDVTATMGGGRVQFGGRIGFDGYLPGGSQRHRARRTTCTCAIPEGIRSAVDADLALRGNVQAPTLGGMVTVKSALWNRRIDTPGSIFDLGRRAARRQAPAPLERRRAGGGVAAEVRRADSGAVDAAGREQPGAAGRQRRPHAARHLRSAGDLRARRHRARRGDVRGAALPDHARHRSTSRTRRASSRSSTSRPRPTCACRARPIASPWRFAGTTDRLRPTLELRSAAADRRRAGAAVQRRPRAAPRRRAELRALQNPNQAQTDILTARATQALASADFGGGRQSRRADLRRRHLPAHAVVRRSVPASAAVARLNPTARLTIGKRISDRVYLTFSRSLSTSSTIRSCCSSTTRAIGCPGSCRATKTRRPTRSSSA